MGLTTTQLKALLAKCPGVACADVEAGTALPFILTRGTPPLPMVADAGDLIVQFRTMAMLMAPGLSYRRTLLRALLEMNYRYKLVKFTFDEDDGEVVAYIDLCVGTGTLTALQIQRCMGAFESVVGQGRTRCTKIMETGVDAGEGDADAAVALGLLREILEARVEGSERSGRSVREAPQPLNRKPRSTGGFTGLLDDLADSEPADGQGPARPRKPR